MLIIDGKHMDKTPVIASIWVNIITLYDMLLTTLNYVLFFSAHLIESKLINTYFLNKERFPFVCCLFLLQITNYFIQSKAYKMESFILAL